MSENNSCDSIWIIDPLNTDWLSGSVCLDCETWSTNIDDIINAKEETLCCFEKSLLLNNTEE